MEWLAIEEKAVLKFIGCYTVQWHRRCAVSWGLVKKKIGKPRPGSKWDSPARNKNKNKTKK
jgi:hypothetical protein